MSLEELAKALKIDVDSADIKNEISNYRSFVGYYDARNIVLTNRVMSKITELVETVENLKSPKGDK